MSSKATASEPRLEARRSKAARVAGCALLAALAASCKQETLCQELGDCGGDLIGSWALGPGHESCSEDVTAPPSDTRLRGGDVPPQRVPAPEQAFADWCSGLIAGTENVLHAPPSFFSESMPFGSATVRYHADGTYSMGLARTGSFYFEFSATCMRQFGAVDGRSPPNTTDPPTNVCKQLQVPLAMSGGGEGSYRNVTCDPNPAEPLGCLCFFDVAEVSGSGGKYQIVGGNQILHTPNTPGFSFRATYCRDGDSLQLTGADGSYLLNKPALRTLDLGLVNCADGVQGIGEDGIDCGSACDLACPTP